MPIERSRQRGASTVLDADTPEALQVSTEEALGHLLRSETYYTRTKKQAAKLAEEASLLPIRLERVRWEGSVSTFAHAALALTQLGSWLQQASNSHQGQAEGS